MKSLVIYLLVAAGLAMYIQTRIAGAIGDGCTRGDVSPIQITREGFILNSMALMIFTENRKMVADSGRTGRCEQEKMQMDTNTETKARLRYLRSLTIKGNGLPGYISQPGQGAYLRNGFSPATVMDNAGAPGPLYDADTRTRRAYTGDDTAGFN